MQLDKQFVKELLHSIRNSLMNNKKEKSKKFLFNMIELYLLLTQEDVNLKSLEEKELDLEDRNHIDEKY